MSQHVVRPSGVVVNRIGVVGAGQLARMLFEAAIPLGIDLRILAERPDDSAAQVSPSVEIGSAQSAQDLARFVAMNLVTTFDHELVNADALSDLEKDGHAIHPTAAVVALAQDKRAQRTVLSQHGFPVPAFQVVRENHDLARFGETHGWPIVAKSIRGGYDGRGVWVIDDAAQAQNFTRDVNALADRFIVERWVPIERELAVLVARSPSGKTAVYPVVETIQRGGICHELVVPARCSPNLSKAAHEIGLSIATTIDATGILAIELFESRGEIFVNELAARPHNSGHFTIEGCVTSQFEQHLRSVLDWPLGSTELRAPAVATVNVLGGPRGEDPRSRLSSALDVPGAHIHLYGKEPRPGRKLGHVTVLADDAEDALDRARAAAERLVGSRDAGAVE